MKAVGKKNIFHLISSSVYRFFSEYLPGFIKDTFEVSKTKRSTIAGGIISAVLMLIVVLDHKAFTGLEFSQKWILLALAMVLPLLIGLLIIFNIKIKHHKLNSFWHFAVLFLMPFLTISMTECLNNIFIYDMTYLGFFANYILILLLYFLVFALTGSFRVAIVSINPVLWLLATVHCYVAEFRGTPFLPMDFLSITTAANVADTYSYRLTHTILLGALIFILSMVIAIKLKTPKFTLITKAFSRIFTGSLAVIIMCIFYFTSIFANAGVKPDFWNQSRGYRNYGFAFSFFCNTKYLFMSQPSGYDPDAVGDYVSSTVEGDNEPNGDTTVIDPDAPNIICIMNESLSDLQVLGEFTTNEDYMPFLRSLTENTIKGNLFVPVIGAGTSNTEFEFLTGHSTAFLPSGSNAYMLYIKNPLATLVSTLEGQGYSSIAFHPYYASGWNRVSVYKNMGFNSFASISDVVDTSITNAYFENGNDAELMNTLAEQMYPGQGVFMRQYVSDHYNYNKLIEDFENRDKNVPYFMFNVTMQNHGGYTGSHSNFEESIWVTSSQHIYRKTNKYLSLVKASDDAFKELIEYFSNVDDPTVICMFGDHQPSIETAFISEVMGVKDLSNLNIEQEQRRYTTPFYIWANYDIEEREIQRLSVNYLSSYVLDAAGVQLTEYNRYLIKLSEKLPVIDTAGYIDAAGTYYRWSDNSEYAEMLDEYEKIQYNNIFDSDNKNTDIFYVKGYQGDEGKKTDTEE